LTEGVGGGRGKEGDGGGIDWVDDEWNRASTRLCDSGVWRSTMQYENGRICRDAVGNIVQSSLSAFSYLFISLFIHSFIHRPLIPTCLPRNSASTASYASQTAPLRYSTNDLQNHHSTVLHSRWHLAPILKLPPRFDPCATASCVPPRPSKHAFACREVSTHDWSGRAGYTEARPDSISDTGRAVDAFAAM